MITLKCQYCGKEFQAKDCLAHTRKFCSNFCKFESKKRRIVEACSYCGKKFEIKLSKRNKSINSYCSRKCQHLAHTEKIEMKCDCCGKTFYRVKSQINKANKHFCNNNCKQKYFSQYNVITIKENYAELQIISPKYGRFITLFDIEDIDKIKLHTWGVRFDPKLNGFYVNCAKFNGKNKALHRYIMNCSDDMVIDHINHNTLDNRKCNLNKCYQLENMQNMYHKAKTTTNILHICYLKKLKLYSVTMQLNKESKQTFVNTLEKALIARENFYKYFENKYGKSPRKNFGRK